MAYPTLLFVVAAALYLTPGLIAVLRKRSDQWPILLSNVLFGWTIIGWVGSLMWACRSQMPVRAKKPKVAMAQRTVAAARGRDDRFASRTRKAYQWDDLEGRRQYASWLEREGAGDKNRAAAT